MTSIRNTYRSSLALALGLGLALAGCDSKSEKPTTTTPTAKPAPVDKAPGKAAAIDKAARDVVAAKPVDGAKVEVKELTTEQIADIKKLPTEADQKIAMEQKVCPVSKDSLGEMGVPVKVMLNDQAVFLCCKSCVKEAKENPEATLAKLGKK